jgi:carbamoyltransferase
MNIVGISAHFHDSACCLLQDGVLTAAAHEESFTRTKHDASLPKNAFRYCLAEGGIDIRQVDSIAYYEEPVRKLGRQIWSFGPALPRSRSMLLRMNARRPETEIRELLGYDGAIHYARHHHAHAASSYYWSGFSESAIMTVDGVGEWSTTSYGAGIGDDIDIFEEVEFPDSLGLLYSTITGYLGFAVNDGEYKVMGLAPYGTPKYARQMWRLIKSCGNGQFELDLRYFDFTRLDRMHSDELPELFGQPQIPSGGELLGFHSDVARSLQYVLEEILVEKARYLHTRTDIENLCMAGGVALNCVANSAILNRGPFRRLFIQPAANDAGGALGAAAIAHRELTGSAPVRKRLEHVYLGPGFCPGDVLRLMNAAGLQFGDYTGDEAGLLAATVDRLAMKKVIGWFQGRMEFGPRALGARSIIADPRDPDMRDRINALVKKREAFRPFAPAVLASRASEHFEIDHCSPFMLETFQVRSPLSLPAITHVDQSARVQTVSENDNPRFARLLEAFEARSGCPIVLNTSFNMKDEPIVCSPVDAFLCFARSDLDALVIEDFIVDRESLPDSWLALFESLRTAKSGPPLLRAYTLI